MITISIHLFLFKFVCLFKVKLENHTLHIHDDKDSEDSVVVKLKLSNCVVKDRGDQQRPFVMEIRRALGRTHFLQAQSESGVNEEIARTRLPLTAFMFLVPIYMQI